MTVDELDEIKALDPLTLAEAMAAALTIRRHVPPHLVSKFDRISEAAIRDTVRRMVDRPSNVVAIRPAAITFESDAEAVAFIEWLEAANGGDLEAISKTDLREMYDVWKRLEEATS